MELNYKWLQEISWTEKPNRSHLLPINIDNCRLIQRQPNFLYLHRGHLKRETEYILMIVLNKFLRACHIKLRTTKAKTEQRMSAVQRQRQNCQPCNKQTGLKRIYKYKWLGRKCSSVRTVQTGCDHASQC